MKVTCRAVNFIDENNEDADIAERIMLWCIKVHNNFASLVVSQSRLSGDKHQNLTLVD